MISGNSHLREELIRQAIESLGKSFNIKANRLGIGSENTQIEIFFTFDGNTFKKVFEVETNRPRHSVIGQILLKQKQLKEKILLITDFISPTTADLLREQGISFLDASGNTFFNEPEFYIFISTRQKEKSIVIPKSNIIFQPSGLSLLFVLLSIPNSESKTYRELAELSRISLGSVNEIMANLVREFYLVEQEKVRLLLRKNELMKRWVQGYGETLRPKLRQIRFQSSSPNWWESFDVEEAKAFWGGEVAADSMTNYLNSSNFTFYSKDFIFTYKYLMQSGLKRNAEGNILLMEEFWNFNQEDIIVPPLLVYADLIATAEARNLEAAQMIYDEYLARLIE